MNSLEDLPHPTPDGQGSNRVSRISASDARDYVDVNSNPSIDTPLEDLKDPMPPQISSSSRSSSRSRPEPHYHSTTDHHQTSCTDMVDRIIQASESRLGYANSSSDAQLKLTAEELDQLSLFSTIQKASDHVESNSNPKHSWADVDVESLTELCTILENHVRASTSIDMVQEARAAFDCGVKQKVSSME